VPEPAEAGTRERDVFFPDAGHVVARIVRRDELEPETSLAGPAIVEFMDSTAVVPPGWTLQTRSDGILEVTR
jgi:N-methylhydantoinase A/oxoprolinase/acetone carboxylase beta subunit